MIKIESPYCKIGAFVLKSDRCKKITHIDSSLVLQHRVAGGEGVNRIDACAAEKICRKSNQMEVNYERYFNETVIRSRCSFWTSDKKMEP
jgi:hypothetical protein